jgi:glycosyltransferase involved in cell wall biosynthesis
MDGATATSEIHGHVAVVVCTYRRPDRLDRAVREALGQRRFSGQSVIVVEDGSGDDGR